MVLLLVVIRLEFGTPLVLEITALVQFILFLALPSQHVPAGVLRPHE
jgi:hypothetical protein